MPAIKEKCPTCNKEMRCDSSRKLGKKTVNKLVCGHWYIIEDTEVRAHEATTLKSFDGRTLYPFQIKGVEFLEQSNLRGLVADEMGLGKTVQALTSMKLHPEAWPFMCVVKSGLKAQWTREINRWTGLIPFPIQDAKAEAFTGFDAYVISYDLLRRFKNLAEVIKTLGIKTLILDECQQIKNGDSARTKQVRDVVKDCQIKHVIALSGTPIKNNAAEYFTILNLLRPELFPTEAGFINNHLDYYFDGYRTRTGGLKDSSRFRDLTKSFVIRRERSEVLPDLPNITRQFRYSDLGEAVSKAYRHEQEMFEEEMNDGNPWSFTKSSNVLARLSKMRHLTGLAKINPCIDHVMEFLGSTQRKITIFVHHKDVAEILFRKILELCVELNLSAPLSLSSDMDSERRDDVVENFRLTDARVLIASTLASGEGLNLQFCVDCYMLERQWNPANEEQAEGRFIRIGVGETLKQHNVNKVTATYGVAVGTVDEFFAELVERKREVVNSTLGCKSVESWEESSIIRALAEIVLTKGSKKWEV